MPVTPDVIEEEVQATRGLNNELTLTRVFRVSGGSMAGSGIARVNAALIAAGIPSEGDVLLFGGQQLIVQTKTARLRKGPYVDVSVNYSAEGVLQSEISGTVQQVRTSLQLDTQNNRTLPIQTTYKNKTMAHELDVLVPTVVARGTYINNTQPLPPFLPAVLFLTGKTNADTWFGGPPGTWLILSVTSPRSESAPRVETYEFGYRPEGWNPSVTHKEDDSRPVSEDLGPPNNPDAVVVSKQYVPITFAQELPPLLIV